MKQIYVLTGCSSGLGFSLLKKLMHHKRHVIGISRHLGKAEEFKDSKYFKHIKLDLSIAKYIDLKKSLTFEKVSQIYLILNAANFIFEDEEMLEPDEAKKIFDINYFSNLNLVKYLEENNLIRCLFINSISGIESQKGQFQYSASKHALQSFANNLSYYSKNKGFDVMSVNPGGINTELWDKNSVLNKDITRNFLDPDALAEILMNLLEIKGKVYIKSLVILPEHDI